MLFAIVDIETTGGYAQHNKIVEIAIRIHDGQQVIESFDTLINPEQGINPTMAAIHGINDAMVYDAPTFREVAKTIYQLLDGKVFVAHNVNFDYSFLKSEFESMGANFVHKKLCTVRLSRKILPDLPSYSLGNLCQSLGISLQNRHRAGGDVDATAKLFTLLFTNDAHGVITEMVKKNSAETFLPSHLPKEKFINLPEKAGVYYFYNQKKEVIYVGKAKNLRKRIYSHFIGSGETMVKQQFKLLIHDIHVELTGNELVALLLESYEIKRLKPFFNRAQKTKISMVGLFTYEDGRGYIRFSFAKMKAGERSSITFQDLYEARNTIESITKTYHLCSKLTGLQSTTSGCYDHNIGLCQGACLGLENVSDYNEKALEALNYLQNQTNTFALLGIGRHASEKTVVYVEKNKFVGFGYIDTQVHSQLNQESIHDFIQTFDDDLDARKIIQSYLTNHRDQTLLRW